MSQARLPRTEPSTELITAHKGNNCDAHAALQTGDFSALPKHRDSILPLRGHLWRPHYDESRAGAGEGAATHRRVL